MRIKFHYIAGIIVLLAHNFIAQDSTLNYTLDEISIVSDKLDTKLYNVPTKMEIMTEKEIQSINGERLPDILKTKSNIFIKSYGLTPALSTISINGLGAENTLILIDGVKINSFQNSHVDLSIIPKENIERIEIINNGVSSIYGSDAMGGVINIITKNKEYLTENKTSKFGASISKGSFNTLGYKINAYKEIENFNIGMNFNKETSDGNYEYYYKNELKERRNSAHNLSDIGLRAQYIFDKKNIIKFFATFSDQKKEIPGIETGTTPAPTNQQDKNWNNILTVENDLMENLFLKTNFNFQNNFMNYTVGRFLNSTYKNIVYSGSSEIKYKKENYGITSGYNFTNATLESDELLTGISRNQHAFFLSTFIDNAGLLKIYPSVRYDYISDIDEGELTYKLGFNFQPLNSNHFGIRGNAGKNFRAPSFNDLYWKNSGNENLKSEKSVNMESGLFYSFSNYINGKIELTYTHIKAENKIIWTPQTNGLWAPQNIAESKSNNISISFDFTKTISKNLNINFNSGYQFNNTIKTSASYYGDPTINKFIPYLPLQSAKLNFGANYKNLEVNIFYSYSGKHFSDFENKIEMNSYHTIDGNISYQINMFDFVSILKMEINNLTNTDYEVISGYPMPLRFYKLSFTINY
ncbi:MAG: TonB-dependent receptor [Ignavibacteriae bacterium]|nr:TonB-dependent receptor [Ignavibacteriota bacterium]